MSDYCERSENWLHGFESGGSVTYGLQGCDLGDRCGRRLLVRLPRLSVLGPIFKGYASKVQRHNGIIENECAYG